jgi:hypothetical protein
MVLIKVSRQMSGGREFRLKTIEEEVKSGSNA